MSLIEFPYSIYKDQMLPIVPIDIKGGDNWHEMWVFVDSGATYSVLNIREARRLNVNLDKSNKQYIKVGDGSYISVYLVILPVRIMNVEFEAHIGFSEELGIGFNIMGRKDFFRKFTICFCEERSIIQFK